MYESIVFIANVEQKKNSHINALPGINIFKLDQIILDIKI